MLNSEILKGIRVLDFSWVLAGPYATRLLADFGAEVIKVHPLLPEADDAFSRAYYNTWNRNKLSITLNMDDSEGREIARDLVRLSDVVVENFTPRVMENWDFDYDNLKTIKPDIIMLSMSAMGHDGPYRDYTAFGPTIQAFAGLTALTSYSPDEPVGAGFSYSDHVAGLYGSFSILAALENRRRTGQGYFIDLSQTECMCSLLADPLMQASGKPVPEKPPVYEGVLRCQGDDRWCAITVSNEEQWQAFMQIMGKPEPLRKLNLKAVRDHKEAVDSVVQGWTSHRTAEEVMTTLQQHGIAAGVAQNSADMFKDPQFNYRGFFYKTQDLSAGDASPVRLSENPSLKYQPAPPPGHHNDYVYQKVLGMDSTKIRRLQQNKVI